MKQAKLKPVKAAVPKKVRSRRVPILSLTHPYNLRRLTASQVEDLLATVTEGVRRIHEHLLASVETIESRRSKLSAYGGRPAYPMSQSLGGGQDGQGEHGECWKVSVDWGLCGEEGKQEPCECTTYACEDGHSFVVCV